MAEYCFKNAAALPDPAFEPRALNRIPDWRKQYILKYRNAIDRKLSLGAWRLTERELEKRGFSAADIKVGANGKLVCGGAYFNISHSGEIVMFAYGGAPVGCDIERVTTAHLDIMRRVFTESEQSYINSAKDLSDRDRRFFRLWTIKESCLKMSGEGLAVSPLRFEINPETNEIFRDSRPLPCAVTTGSYQEYEFSICEAFCR